jgi:hypothetical protein
MLYVWMFNRLLTRITLCNRSSCRFVCLTYINQTHFNILAKIYNNRKQTFQTTKQNLTYPLASPRI